MKKTVFVAWVCLGVLAFGYAAADEPLQRHHIGLQIGPFNPSSDRIEIDGLDLDIEGNTGFGGLNYRYSLNPFVDLALDFRAWSVRWETSIGREIELTSGFAGLGIRLNALDRSRGQRIIPFVQGNIYVVQKEFNFVGTMTESGGGVGINGGVDIIVSHLISIPIEFVYLGTPGDDGDGIDDLSGVGFSAGVNFNF